MNRIKRNGYQKILSLTLSASLLLGLTGCGAQKAEETAATASEEEALLTEALRERLPTVRKRERRKPFMFWRTLPAAWRKSL